MDTVVKDPHLHGTGIWMPLFDLGATERRKETPAGGLREGRVLFLLEGRNLYSRFLNVFLRELTCSSIDCSACHYTVN